MRKIVIYGAGEYGNALFNTIVASGEDISFFIDQYTKQKELNGKNICRVEDVTEEDKDAFVFISLAFNNADAIIKLLKDKGFEKVFDFVESFHEFPMFLQFLMKTNLLWMRENKSELVDADEINKFKTMLSDDKSINLLNSIVEFRESLTPSTYLMPDLQTQYFPDDIELFENIENLRFVDCGAYIGDTIESVLNVHDSVESIVSLEPDMKNLDKLLSEVEIQKQNNNNTNFIVYPSGVWSENTILSFSADGNSASSINDTNSDDKNNVQISAVSLDKTIIGIAPNYIKMDIEGAEKEALLGAKRIIEKYKPVLAICVYHNPKDLWEIPFLINKLNPGYKMYLRTYAHMGLETVVYCVHSD